MEGVHRPGQVWHGRVSAPGEEGAQGEGAGQQAPRPRLALHPAQREDGQARSRPQAQDEEGQHRPQGVAARADQHPQDTRPDHLQGEGPGPGQEEDRQDRQGPRRKGPAAARGRRGPVHRRNGPQRQPGGQEVDPRREPDGRAHPQGREQEEGGRGGPEGGPQRVGRIDRAPLPAGARAGRLDGRLDQGWEGGPHQEGGRQEQGPQQQHPQGRPPRPAVEVDEHRPRQVQHPGQTQGPEPRPRLRQAEDQQGPLPEDAGAARQGGPQGQPEEEEAQHHPRGQSGTSQRAAQQAGPHHLVDEGGHPRQEGQGPAGWRGQLGSHPPTFSPKPAAHGPPPPIGGERRREKRVFYCCSRGIVVDGFPPPCERSPSGCLEEEGPSRHPWPRRSKRTSKNLSGSS